LRRKGAELRISGHLWPSDQEPSAILGHREDELWILDQVEMSDIPLLDHSAPPRQNSNLVGQASSQRMAIDTTLQSLNFEPDLVLVTRTDLWISSVKSLMIQSLKDGEVWISDFHHADVDDNVAILNWATFKKLAVCDFQKALERPEILFGEQLRAELFQQAGIQVSHRIIPCVILRKSKSPSSDLALTWTRLIFRKILPSCLYKVGTSPKTELLRLAVRVFQRFNVRRDKFL
jgi:hypothetical protein